MRTKRFTKRSATSSGVACAVLSAATLFTGCKDRDAIEQTLAPEVTSTSTSFVDAVTTKPEIIPAITPSPEEVKTAWKEGVALFQAGDYVTASVQLQIAASGRTEDPYVHYLLGLSLWKSGEPDLAEKALERAAALDQSSLKTWINLARIRMDLDESQTALDAAESALAIDPFSAAALHQRGRALATLGKRDEALETLRKAHEADPKNGYIANTLGYHLIRAGREAEALPFLETARDKLPGVSYVRNNLGVAYERTGQREKAEAEYRAAVEAGESGGKAAASLVRLESAMPQAVAKQQEVPKPAGLPVAEATPRQDPD